MTTILTATLIDARLLVELGSKTFMESHGHCASKKDVEKYVSEKFSLGAFERELKISNNYFYIIYHDEKPVGYSKIVLNVPHANIPFGNATKLERLYVLEEYHHLKLGWELFKFNLNVSKSHNQLGLWLYTWVENHKAIRFYKKAGFEIVGEYDFRISETHSNPNHQMLLVY